MGTQFARGGTHGYLVPEYWSQKLFKDSFASNPLAQYMGKGSDSIIQVNMDLTKKKGDKITFGLRDLLTDNGQTDDGTYEGNEESMTFQKFSLQLHERGHSVILNGNMSEQSAAFNLRSEAKTALAEWKGRVAARDIIDSLSGLVSHGFTGQILGASALATDASSSQINTVQQVAPSRSSTAARYFCGGQTSAGTLTRVDDPSDVSSSTGYTFGTKVIEYVKRMAQKEVNSSSGAHITPIRPIYVDGEPFYLMLVDPLQIKALRGDADWLNAVQYAQKRGNSNWLFSGAAGIWDGVVIKPTTLLHRRTGAGGITGPEYFDATGEACASGVSVVRSLFLGAQAGCVGYGKMPSWQEGHSDWQKTKWGFHTNWIYGVKKTAKYSATSDTVTSDSEFGSIIVDTAVVAD
ncbi:MAG TPA: DUF4043 family protein [Planctomycetes bacterium]|nr:DUF4043 family protein [Planctomycetota bacterium]